ncbi:hypothetical protein [Ligilactobacillus murinus]|uniref:hypothetical protein n=1 Tax=Ligilactobacillus murinus TaxID=1622 RepID=UPI002DD66F14|nr:hypothetical protein [Ligilactobacillus murinus]WRY37795.1 hypothetical protein P8F80_00130 [Ligilactobacillus murinus]
MKNKLALTAYRIFSRAYFYLPFLMIIFYFEGFNLLQIEILLALYGVGSFVATKFLLKVLTHTYSCSSLLILGEVVKISGLTILLVTNNFVLLGFAQLLLGIGYAIAAGKDTTIILAWKLPKNDNFQERTNGYMFISLMISGIVGSYLFEFNYKLPIILTILFTALGIISVLAISPKVFPTQPKKTSVGNNSKFLAKDKFWIMHYAVLRCLILGTFTGFLPYYFFVEKKLSAPKFILILTTYTVSGYFASNFITKKTNFPYLSEITLAIFTILFLSQNIWVLTIAMIFLGISSGLTRPQTISHLKHTQSFQYKLATAEMLYALITPIFLLVGGQMYIKYSIQGVLYLIMITFIVYSTLLIIWRSNNEN